MQPLSVSWFHYNEGNSAVMLENEIAVTSIIQRL
uniref:Uncharacterized protein n=1 Tax=Ciona intestinalis TaxID=7719 RepID=H2XPL9_CIOIN